MNESRSLSSFGRDAAFDTSNIKNFTDDHQELIRRVQSLRKDLADWREFAAARTVDYTDELKELQDELLRSMKQLKNDVQVMKSKVKVALDKHDPTRREEQAERR